MTDILPKVIIYTDGGADPNPGPGGWGVVMIHDSTRAVKELSGGESDTTNNRMELTAVIKALETLKQPCQVAMYTDSTYVKRGITEWIHGWIKNDWKKRKGTIQNVDLWKWLYQLSKVHQIDWLWVKGHAGNPYNEKADQLASAAIRGQYRQEAPESPDLIAAADAEIFLLVSARDGKGWWGSLLKGEGDEQVLWGREVQVTSNQLDLIAAIDTLAMLPIGSRVRLYTVSDYLRNGATQWIHGWRAKGWKKRDGTEVKNRELWEQLDEIMTDLRIDWPIVKHEETPGEFEVLAERLQEIVWEQQRSNQSDDPDDWAD